MCTNIKSTRIRPEFSDILLPGERAFLTAQQQTKNGIHIDSQTWSDMKALAKKLNVSMA